MFAKGVCELSTLAGYELGRKKYKNSIETVETHNPRPTQPTIKERKKSVKKYIFHHFLNS